MKRTVFLLMGFVVAITGCSKKDKDTPSPVTKTHTIRVVSTGSAPYRNYIGITKAGETTLTYIDSQENLPSGSYEFTTKQDAGTMVTLRIQSQTLTPIAMSFTFYDNDTIVGKTQSFSATTDVTAQHLIK